MLSNRCGGIIKILKIFLSLILYQPGQQIRVWRCLALSQLLVAAGETSTVPSRVLRQLHLRMNLEVLRKLGDAYLAKQLGE